ncbi:hypothetical protein V500_00560 [Pseudogymnoascus sp. VKM F-4518 (FW-2643)]|nr:hypothetical protein V500_00560 [Pseudogymnoascus sp. VKM F-4518 (FW-2643)]
MDLQDQLRDLLLDPGPSPVVALFISQERDRLDLSSILEQTFRRVDLGPRDLVCRQGAYVSLDVEFLVRQGARFDNEICDVDKLLEDTYRYIELGPLSFKRREGACLSPEVEFLLNQGADFSRVPGLPRIVEDTITYLENSRNKPNFLLQQAIHHNIHLGWRPLLYEVNKFLLKAVDSETLCEIIGVSNHKEEIKVYTTPFKEKGIYWPFFTYNWKSGWLENAIITELQERPRGWRHEVHIKAQGRYITTLKALLSARSPFFKELIRDKQNSFEVPGLYKTIKFALLYERTELKLWSEDYTPCDSRTLTEDTLDELINILHVTKIFRMVDLFVEVQRHIIIRGKGFIYAKNAQEIKDIANEVNAVYLGRYCDAFIASNLRTFTLFPSLPTELRLCIWSQVASRPRVVLAHRLHKLLETPPQIVSVLRVCRNSNAEIPQSWGKPRMGGVKFEIDILWLETHYLPFSISVKEARYCAAHAPDAGLHFDWEYKVSKIIKCCPLIKVLYLTTGILSDNDELEYCRRFTNREPTTLAEARDWIEESAHQRLHRYLRRESPDDWILPKIILIDRHEIKRLTATIIDRNEIPLASIT